MTLLLQSLLIPNGFHRPWWHRHGPRWITKGIMKSKIKAALDNRANQLNPQHPAYHRARGLSGGQAVKAAQHEPTKIGKSADQLNPNSRLCEGGSTK